MDTRSTTPWTTRIALLATALSVALVVILSPLSALADPNPNPAVLPPQSHPHGKTYGEWGAEWFKYVFSIPMHDSVGPLNPLIDTTGARCGYGQSGSVFFLVGTAGGDATRDDCVVPVGKAIFFPLLNIEDNIREEAASGFPSATPLQMQTLVRDVMNTVTELHTSVDGQPLDNLFAYRGASAAPFTMTVPPGDNLEAFYGYAGISGAVYPTVSDGYWVMLAPLPPGPHVITFGGTADGTYTYLDGNVYPIKFSVNVTYHLTVR